MCEKSNLPQFKYSPNCYERDEVFEKAKPDSPAICQCCGKRTEYFCAMYASADLYCICPDCIASGEAAKKFDAETIDDYERIANGDDKTDELRHRTPGYLSWQGERWLAHCNDYCAFLGWVTKKDLDGLGITKDVYVDYVEHFGDYIEDLLERLGHDVRGYLFRCLHCGKYRLRVDFD